MPYTLENVERLNAAHPATFHIPSRTEREGLRRGDVAKLIFTLPKPINGCESERMWVEVTGRDGDDYLGELDNDPLFPDELGIKWRSPVRFRACHVASI